MGQSGKSAGSAAEGIDLWPCFGYPPGPNLDCPTAGNPTVPLASGGVILGLPSYVWSLQNRPAGSPDSGYGCDASLNGTTGPSGAGCTDAGVARGLPNVLLG